MPSSYPRTCVGNGNRVPLFFRTPGKLTGSGPNGAPGKLLSSLIRYLVSTAVHISCRAVCPIWHQKHDPILYHLFWQRLISMIGLLDCRGKDAHQNHHSKSTHKICPLARGKSRIPEFRSVSLSRNPPDTQLALDPRHIYR
jgi:hypothetical protein